VPDRYNEIYGIIQIEFSKKLSIDTKYTSCGSKILISNHKQFQIIGVTVVL